VTSPSRKRQTPGLVGFGSFWRRVRVELASASQMTQSDVQSPRLEAERFHLAGANGKVHGCEGDDDDQAHVAVLLGELRAGRSVGVYSRCRPPSRTARAHRHQRLRPE
jgi:hypothetical protein